VKGLGVAGQVLALHEGQAELAVGGKRLRVPVEELLEVGGTAGKADPSPSVRPTPPVTSSATAVGSGAAPAEINVIGCTVDEALPRVDKFLDESSLSDRRQVRVIHGFGQGRLRRAVAELLEDHPHVAAFRLGEAKEGGAGATIVELRD
jgi:DNA mismatch repair protein MutS2